MALTMSLALFLRALSLPPGYIGLRHDELNVLLLLHDWCWAGGSCISSLGNIDLVELGGCLHLGLLGEVFNLGLAEHDISVRGGVLVHVGLLDHKKDIL